jgi:hypothetical protein
MTIECRFITVEDEPPDLIVSYCCAQEIDDQENDIMILRTPDHELFLPKEERGAKLSVGYDSDSSEVLESVRIDGSEIEFKAGSIHERRDSSRIDAEEWRESIKMLRRMSSDNAFKLEGV